MVVIAIAIQTEIVQNFLVTKAANKLSKDLGTKVQVQHVSINLFNRLNIEGIFIADKQKDTLLYAKALKVRITDWFFLKDNADLHYVGLDGATIKIQRQDTIWNYQFIANYFTSTDTTKKSPKKGLNLQPKKIEITNTIFIQNDAWRGETQTAKIGSLTVNVDSLLFDKNEFFLNTIILHNLSFSIYNFNGNRPKDYKPKLVATNTSTPTKQPLLLKINEIKIDGSVFNLNANPNKPIKMFDGSHIQFANIKANLQNTIISADTLTTKLQLSTKERSGFNLKKLQANFKFTPRIMELANMEIVTNNSRLTNYYAMKFTNFDDDFANYETNVVMDAKFKNSIINSDDVAYFAPDLKDWNKELFVTANFIGTVANFNVTNLFAKEKNNSTTIQGNLAMKGLPNIYTTTINFNDGIIKTNHKDLSAIVPALKGVTNPNLSALGTVTYTGNFNGTLNKFVSNATLQTNLGTLKTNITMQLPKNKEAWYDGAVELANFNLGKFINEDKLGVVNFTGSITGQSFNPKSLQTNLKGKFSRLDFNDYSYKNIATNGTFKNQYFNGEVKIDDENLDLTGQVEVDFKDVEPKFNILGDIVKSNFKPLNFTKDDLKLTGLLDVVFTGTNIDNFLGSAKLLNAEIANAQGKLNFDSLTLTTSLVDSGKLLHFASNEFTVNVIGNYKILELPTAFQSFLHKYYPTYIAEPAKMLQNQKFAVTLNTRFIEPYLQLWNKEFSGFNDASLTGFIDTKTNQFTMGLLVPYGKYKNYILSGAEIVGQGTLDSLKLTGNLNSLQVSDSLIFPNTKLGIVSSNDYSNVSIKTNSLNNLYEANLNAEVRTLQDGVFIQFNPSSFILNEKQWNLEKEGNILITKNAVEAKNVKFTQGFQEIAFETETIDGANVNTLKVKLKDVVLGDITNIFTSNPRLEGVANGTINMEDFFGKFKINTDNIVVTNFQVDDDSIGVAKLKAAYASNDGILKFQIQSPNPGYNFNADGILNFKDTLYNPINTSINLDNSKIDIVQKFLGNDIFSGLNGYATGKISITGKASDLQLSGAATLRNAGLKVEYTQVYYKIDSANLNFDEDGINFNEFSIKDTLGNTGWVKGKLYHKGFKNMFFDFDLGTAKLLLLNTQRVHNDVFYGAAIGKANLSFKGPESNAKLRLSGEPTDSSHIYIVNSDSKESADASFIEFATIGKEMKLEKKDSRFNLGIDLDLVANNKLDIDVILDDLTGDAINAKGNGSLRIKTGTNENLDMRGRFNIESGSYKFDFQSIVRRPFYFRNDGTNFIEWSGNPFNANININAIYEAKGISINDLVSNSQSSISSSSRNARGEVYIIANLSGQLSKPNIKFKLDFPQSSPLKTDDVLARYLKRIEDDENEMLKQVMYLIVFNSFAPSNESGNNQGSLASIGVNTISSILTKQVNKSITNFLHKLTGDKSIQFDLNTAIYNSGDLFNNGSVNASSNQFDKANVKFKIGKNFFNDKVILTFGNEFDFNIRNAAQTGNFQWLPDVNVEIVLGAGNKLRMLIFTKNSLDVTGGSLGRRNRQGIGLTFKKDFDKTLFEKDTSSIIFNKP